jgi:hypothetical protein
VALARLELCPSFLRIGNGGALAGFGTAAKQNHELAACLADIMR